MPRTLIDKWIHCSYRPERTLRPLIANVTIVNRWPTSIAYWPSSSGIGPLLVEPKNSELREDLLSDKKHLKFLWSLLKSTKYARLTFLSETLATLMLYSYFSFYRNTQSHYIHTKNYTSTFFYLIWNFLFTAKSGIRSWFTLVMLKLYKSDNLISGYLSHQMSKSQKAVWNALQIGAVWFFLKFSPCFWYWSSTSGQKSLITLIRKHSIRVVFNHVSHLHFYSS